MSDRVTGANALVEGFWTQSTASSSMPTPERLATTAGKRGVSMTVPSVGLAVSFAAREEDIDATRTEVRERGSTSTLHGPSGSPYDMVIVGGMISHFCGVAFQEFLKRMSFQRGERGVERPPRGTVEQRKSTESQS